MADLFPGPDKTTTAVGGNQDLNQRTGYLFNYNFNIQQQTPARTAFEAGYMGNTGQKQYGSVLLNQPRLPVNKDNPGVLPDTDSLSDPGSGIQPEHELSVEQLQRRLPEVRAASVA